jgi:hypothetical protein
VTDERKVLSREEIESEIESFTRKIGILERTERSADSVAALKFYRDQRELLANYLKRIDSSDAF